MSDSLTALLQQSRQGDPEVLNQLYQRCYAEIKRLAAAQLARLNPGNTITPTVLMHDCYLKLSQGQVIDFQNSRHFFACLGKSMRHLLIDVYRSKNSPSRSAGQQVDGVTQLVGDQDVSIRLMDLQQVFARIERINPRLAELIEIKLFVGLSVPEIAAVFQCSVRKVINDWSHAKSLIHALLEEHGVTQ